MINLIARSICAASVLAILTFGPAQAAGAKRPKPLADAASVQAALTSGGKPALFPGSVVHIPTFRVELVTEVSETASTSGFAAGGRATQSTTYQLRGVDPAQMTRITQALYDELVASLKAQGYSVATPAQTLADPDLGPMMTGAVGPVSRPSKSGVSSFYAPAGLNVVIDALDPSQPINSLSGFAGAGEAMKRALVFNRAVVRGITVLQPKYTLGFADLSANTDGFLGRLGDVAAVSANVGLRVEPDSTRWDVLAPADTRAKQTGGFVAVDTALTVAGAALTPAVNATPAQQAQGTAFANLLAMGASAYTGSTNTFGANTKAVQPALSYPVVAGQALSTVQSVLLARVAAGKP